MGYYSQVAIAMRNEEYNQLKGGVAANNKDLEGLLNIANKREYDNFIILNWDWIKWYDTFSEIQAIENFFNDLDIDIPYKIIRLGEDYDDTEVKWNYGNPVKYGRVVDEIAECMEVYRGIDFLV